MKPSWDYLKSRIYNAMSAVVLEHTAGMRFSPKCSYQILKAPGQGHKLSRPLSFMKWFHSVHSVILTENQPR